MAMVERLEIRRLLSGSHVPVLPAGSLDPTFGARGISTFTSGIPIVQPDGKILLIGSGIWRENPDGTPDATFGAGGLVRTTGNVASVLPDGRILVAGVDASAANYTVTRLNPNGSVDTSFGAAGGISTPAAPHSSVADLRIQPDGKFVVLAESPDTTADHFHLLRFNSDGTPDTTFGTGGDVVVQSFTGVAMPLQLAVAPDGKILVTGIVQLDSYNGHGDVQVYRVNPDGSRDRTFGTDGVLDTRIDSISSSLAVLPDSRLLMVAGGKGAISVRRLNADGSADATFGKRGEVQLCIGEGGFYTSCGIAVAPDGSLFVEGVQSNDALGFDIHLIGVNGYPRYSATHLGVFHLTQSGRRDPHFGKDGSVSLFGGAVLTASPAPTEFPLDGNGNPIIALFDQPLPQGAVARILGSPQSVFATQSGKRVTIHATSGSDTLSISEVPVGSSPLKSGPAVRITLNGMSEMFNPSTFKRIELVWPGHPHVVVAAPLTGTVQQIVG